MPGPSPAFALADKSLKPRPTLATNPAAIGRARRDEAAAEMERHCRPVPDDEQSVEYHAAAENHAYWSRFTQRVEREQRRRQQAEFQARHDEQAKQARQQAATVTRIAPKTVVARDRARRSPSRSAASRPPARSDDSDPPASPWLAAVSS